MNLEETRRHMIERYGDLLKNIRSADEDLRREDEIYWKARISELISLFYDIFGKHIG